MREFTTDKTMVCFFKSQIVLFQIISGTLAEKVTFSFLQKSQVTFSTEAPEMIWETAREPRRAKTFAVFDKT
jgi:hypothetical protein